MKQLDGSFLLAAVLSAIAVIPFFFLPKNSTDFTEKEEPSDWFIMQRIFPYGKVDYEAYKNALSQKKTMTAPNSLRDYLQWTQAGPVNIGGRVQDIEMDPTNTETIYVGAASG